MSKRYADGDDYAKGFITILAMIVAAIGSLLALFFGNEAVKWAGFIILMIDLGFAMWIMSG